MRSEGAPREVARGGSVFWFFVKNYLGIGQLFKFFIKLFRINDSFAIADKAATAGISRLLSRQRSFWSAVAFANWTSDFHAPHPTRPRMKKPRWVRAGLLIPMRGPIDPYSICTSHVERQTLQLGHSYGASRDCRLASQRSLKTLRVRSRCTLPTIISVGGTTRYE
jgi:hypothetical protein